MSVLYPGLVRLDAAEALRQLVQSRQLVAALERGTEFERNLAPHVARGAWSNWTQKPKGRLIYQWKRAS